MADYGVPPNPPYVNHDISGINDKGHREVAFVVCTAAPYTVSGL